MNSFNEFKIDKDRVKKPILQDKKHIRFPYIKLLANKINKCFKNTNNNLVFYNLTKINSIYTKLKDKVDKFDQSNLVYKIPCECDKSYIGQTKQKLKKRLDQQKNDCKPINVNKTNTTALDEHHFKTGHTFKFDAATILDLEENCGPNAHSFMSKEDAERISISDARAQGSTREGRMARRQQQLNILEANDEAEGSSYGAGIDDTM
ncbi:hypothetical protein M0804_013915 [Polistes exclamans]|nr:hypothetical protein M0804_013915 [Polistes exclamans]